ncbi:MAG: AAA family ATPase [Phycisphaerales bacterium]|nr:AAA family ATPase [Phycisphaerales bacterium]
MSQLNPSNHPFGIGKAHASSGAASGDGQHELRLADSPQDAKSASFEACAADRDTFERKLRDVIGEHRFRICFETGARVACSPGCVRIATETSFQADLITRNLRLPLEAVARELFGNATLVEVAVESAAQSIADSTPSATLGVTEISASKQPERNAPSVSVRPRTRLQVREGAFRRLDDFVVGDANKLAFSAAEAFAQKSMGSPSVLFLHGECGVGKTHLLQGICRRWTEALPHSTIRYATAEQFTNEYIAAVRASTLDDFRRSIRKLDLLAIDDVHFFASKNQTQAEFLHTIDAIALSGARLALVSDEHPRQIKRFSESLISRFLSGMVVRLDRPDRSTRLSLVRRLATERRLVLRPCAEEVLVSRCAGSVREIEGALARLVAVARLDDIRTAITGLIAERMLGDHVTQVLPSAPIRLSRIIEAVVGRLGISRDELLASARHQRATRARGVVAHLARELTTHSYPEIARALGRSAHSSVHAGAKAIQQLLQGDGLLFAGLSTREAIDQLRHDLVRGARTQPSLHSA